jgi:hypothetical protein
MLSLFIVFAVAMPLMIWALSPAPVRKRKSSQGSLPPVDVMSMPPAGGLSGFHLESSCDAGSGGCDGGGS